MEICKLNFCEINRVESGECRIENLKCRIESGEFRAESTDRNEGERHVLRVENGRFTSWLPLAVQTE